MHLQRARSWDKGKSSSSLTQVDKNMLAAYLGTTRLPLPWSRPLAGRTDADADVQALRTAQWCMPMPASVWTSKIYSVAGLFPPSRSRAGGAQQRAGPRPRAIYNLILLRWKAARWTGENYVDYVWAFRRNVTIIRGRPNPNPCFRRGYIPSIRENLFGAELREILEMAYKVIFSSEFWSFLEMTMHAIFRISRSEAARN